MHNIEYNQIPASYLTLVGFKASFLSMYTVSLGVSDFASQGVQAFNKEQNKFHIDWYYNLKVNLEVIVCA